MVCLYTYSYGVHSAIATTKGKRGQREKVEPTNTRYKLISAMGHGMECGPM